MLKRLYRPKPVMPIVTGVGMAASPVMSDRTNARTSGAKPRKSSGPAAPRASARAATEAATEAISALLSVEAKVSSAQTFECKEMLADVQGFAAKAGEKARLAGSLLAAVEEEVEARIAARGGTSAASPAPVVAETTTGLRKKLMEQTEKAREVEQEAREEAILRSQFEVKGATVASLWCGQCGWTLTGGELLSGRPRSSGRWPLRKLPRRYIH